MLSGRPGAVRTSEQPALAGAAVFAVPRVPSAKAASTPPDTAGVSPPLGSGRRGAEPGLLLVVVAPAAPFGAVTSASAPPSTSEDTRATTLFMETPVRRPTSVGTLTGRRDRLSPGTGLL